MKKHHVLKKFGIATAIVIGIATVYGLFQKLFKEN